MFLNFFSKTEAGHVLKMFLQFWLISASRSYKLGSYKKKRVFCKMSSWDDNLKQMLVYREIMENIII